MRRLLAAVFVVAGSVVVPMALPADAGGGCHNPSPTEATGSTVEISGMCFRPTVLRVNPGTVVSFVNRDGADHNLSGVNLDDFYDLPIGATVQERFDAAGTFPYTCNLHPGMTGVVIVGDGRGDAESVQVAEPALASADRAGPTPAAEGDSGVSPAVVVAAAAAAGALGFLVARRTRKESAPEA